MVRPVVDGQRQPRPPAMGPLSLRAPVVDPIAAPETIEVSMSLWTDLDEFPDTLPMDLSELKGSA